MHSTPLRIRFGDAPLRPAAGWLVSGERPDEWLREVATWPVSHANVRFLPLPASRRDRRPVAALVTLTKPAGIAKRHSVGCAAFGVVAERLFLPVEATLAPDLTEVELAELLSDQYLYVWRPHEGLVAFEPAEQLRMADLLAGPPTIAAAWDHAVPGLALPPRLMMLTPAVECSIEQIREQGQDDIGSSQDQISQLPPSPQEPSNDLLSAAGRQARNAAAHLARWLASAGSSASARSSASGRIASQLRSWAERQFRDLQRGLEASRNRELARLMHLLSTDPDRGLRFAMPLGGNAPRGRARPSAQLSERPLHFDLESLGGGGPADYWEVDRDYHYRLAAKYRELANRELQLGRHCRAAYIFAELLNDLEAAGSALVSGGHYREAAVLYRQRLNRPRDALLALEKGGFWMEAIAFCEELGEHEKAGDLYMKLDQRGNAANCYFQAVTKYEDADDLLSAARVLDEKLAAPDHALDTLSAGWPHSQQAEACLPAAFRILGRLGRHAKARSSIAEFRCSSDPPKAAQLVDFLADLSHQYPDPEVKQQAADCSRVLISRRLPQAGPAECARLLEALRRLEPQDRLLGRDCRRFLQRRTPPTRRARGSAPQAVGRFRFSPPGVRWTRFCANGSAVFAAGRREHYLYLARSNWNGAVETLVEPWYIDRWTDESLVLAADQHGRHVILNHFGGQVLDQRILPSSDAFPQPTTVGPLTGMSPNVIAAATAANGATWIVQRQDRYLVLSILGSHGETVSTEVGPLTDFEGEITSPLPFHVADDRAYLGCGERLRIMDQANRLRDFDFRRCIRALAGSPPNTERRIAVSFEMGGVMVWNEQHMRPFAEDLTRPICCFNRGGYLIAIGLDGGHVYRFRGQEFMLESELRIRGRDVVAVLHGPRTDRFAVARSNGEVVIYEIPQPVC